jgi:hypothetical protein
VERPPDQTNERRHKDLDDETPRIILTDADELPVRTKGRWSSDSKLRRFGKNELYSLIRIVARVAKHFPIALIVLLFGVALHLILENLFNDPKFFGLLPVKYMFDAGDIAVIITLFIMLIRDLLKEE